MRKQVKTHHADAFFQYAPNAEIVSGDHFSRQRLSATHLYNNMSEVSLNRGLSVDVWCLCYKYFVKREHKKLSQSSLAAKTSHIRRFKCSAEATNLTFNTKCMVQVSSVHEALPALPHSILLPGAAVSRHKGILKTDLTGII